MQAWGWLPVALGAAAVMAGLKTRRKRPIVLALTAFAGMKAVGAMRAGSFDRGSAGSGRKPDVEVERSITIGKTADELRRCWLDRNTLPRIMADFATVSARGDGRTHWTVHGPLGRSYEWDCEDVDDRSGGAIGWRALPDAAIPNEGTVRFRPAPVGRGTVVSLRLRFDPPGGAVGEAAVKLLGTTPLDLAAERALRRFKSLIESGEIPTTERQPAARADTR